ncbi:hypothetical protein G6F32_015431 [Rhizopus arrhizus]|nr:hypothetical protein G6F32_015431 [Rhizopus arrhizus]
MPWVEASHARLTKSSRAWLGSTTAKSSRPAVGSTTGDVGAFVAWPKGSRPAVGSTKSNARAMADGLAGRPIGLRQQPGDAFGHLGTHAFLQLPFVHRFVDPQAIGRQPRHEIVQRGRVVLPG